MIELRAPEEWQIAFGIRVLDPDGWRRDGKPWAVPISETEFRERAFESTCMSEGGWAA